MSRALSLRELAQVVMGLQDELAEARQTIAEQAEMISGLRAEVAHLRRKGGTDSSSSGLPPSKDKPGAMAGKKPVVSSRQPSGKKRGAQAGHEGR